MDILVLNCGSSSAKFAVISSDSGTERIAGLAQRLGTANASDTYRAAARKLSGEVGPLAKELSRALAAEKDAAGQLIVDEDGRPMRDQP